MKRLSVMVNEMAFLRETYGDSDFDPVQFTVLSEVAGAHGIAATLTGEKNGISEKDIRLIKDLRKTFFNLHMIVDSHMLKLALSVRPEMVTFVDTPQLNSREIHPLIPDTISDVLPEILPDLQASNISVALFIPPEINALKQLSKLQIDYVEFDCRELTGAADSNEQMVALDKLKSAALAAAKLGLGVNCLGGIDYHHLADLVQVAQLEDVCMDLSLLKRSFLVGINQAVSEALWRIGAHR